MSEMCQDLQLPNLLFLRPFNLCILCYVYCDESDILIADNFFHRKTRGHFQSFAKRKKGKKLKRISRIEFQDNQPEKKGHIIE